MSVTLADEQAKNMAASLRNAANVLDPPATTPTPTPIPPATNYANFQLIFDEQFTNDCAEGQALTVYGDRFFFYPATWDDTSNKGLYDPGNFSVSNGWTAGSQGDTLVWAQSRGCAQTDASKECTALCALPDTRSRRF